MDKRSEPRFQVRSAIRIAAIDKPEDVSNALLLDVSGSGMKIIADGWWPVNTFVVIEMENHVVAGRVRNSVPRGSKFSVGVEKVHSVLKHALPAGTSRAEWHELLIREMGDPRLQEQMQTDQVAESDATEPLFEESSEELPEISAAQEPAAEPSVPASQPASANHPASSELSAPPLAQAFPTAPNSAQAGQIRISLPVTPQLRPAQGVTPSADALTPVSTMPDAAEGAPTKPRWIIPSGVAAGLIAILVLALYYGPFRPRASSASTAAAPLTVPSVTATPSLSREVAKTAARPVALPVLAKSVEPAQPAPQAPAKPVSSSAGTSPSAGSRRATLKASGTNWISACADGKRAAARLLTAGDSLDVSFERSAVFRVGDAATAEIEVDGKSLGPLGSAGTVALLEISASGMRNLPVNIPPSAECQAAQTEAKR